MLPFRAEFLQNSALLTLMHSLVQTAERSRAGVMQFASSPHSNLFVAVYVKESLSPSTKTQKNIVLWVVEFVS